MRYNVNKFTEVTNINNGVFHVVSPGWSPSYIYIVEGSSRALVIDTGYGIGNLKGLIEKITTLPYDVVNTHFHGDHTLGNYQFTDVYIHKDDLVSCQKNIDHKIRERFTELPKKMDVPFTINDYTAIAEYNLLPICEGQIFDLGGQYELEVVDAPGHTFGSICLLDRKRRILFTGDALVSTPTFIFTMDNTLKKQATITIYMEAMKRLLLRSSDFDGLYPGHGELNISPNIIHEMIECCREIINDPHVGIDFNFGDNHVKLHRHGKASIAYTNDRIR